MGEGNIYRIIIELFEGGKGKNRQRRTKEIIK